MSFSNKQKDLDKKWANRRKRSKKSRKNFDPPNLHRDEGLVAYYAVRNIRKHF